MLADATRVRMILALRAAGELPVRDLAAAVGRSPSAVSQHLAKLRLARIVAARRDGTTVFYRLTDEHSAALVTEAIRQAEHTLTPEGELPPHHATNPGRAAGGR